VIAGATIAAVATVLIVRLTSPSSFSGSSTPAALGDMPGGGGVAPDISNMSPRERADRLYNRVMTAAESGDSSRVGFFGPMAIQAYGLLGPLDVDGHYHLGMIQLVSHDYSGATSQADSIVRMNPANLLGAALKAEIATRKGDAAARKRAYRDLLANYDREIASGKSEYADHRDMLERMHTEARKAGEK
jgi:hypothetical protein